LGPFLLGNLSLQKTEKDLLILVSSSPNNGSQIWSRFVTFNIDDGLNIVNQQDQGLRFESDAKDLLPIPFVIQKDWDPTVENKIYKDEISRAIYLGLEQSIFNLKKIETFKPIENRVERLNFKYNTMMLSKIDNGIMLLEPNKYL
jgi:hypothetical protein